MTIRRGHRGARPFSSFVCQWVVVAAMLCGGVRGATAEPLITTIAGNGERAASGDSGRGVDFHVGQPFGVVVHGDGAGGLYITEVENNRVLRLDLATGDIATVAGNGQEGYSGDGGPATRAELWEPYEVRFDDAGDMYFVEMRNAVVRRVDAKTGLISTVAGTGRPGFSGDGGPATRAQLSSPHSIALDGAGGLYIADIGNHRIRKVDLASGVIETIAGTGEKKMPVDGGAALGNAILGPRALDIKDGVMWIALREGNSVWTLDLRTGLLAHVAGTGTKGYTGDGAAAKLATFNGPKGIAIAPNGLVYVADTENQVIRVIDPTSGTIGTVAGAGPEARGFGGDGSSARMAKMDRPHGVCVGPDGAIYIGDTNNHRVRKVEAK